MNDKRILEEFSRKRAEQELETKEAAKEMKEALASDIKQMQRKFLEECRQELTNPSPVDPMLKSILKNGGSGYRSDED